MKSRVLLVALALAAGLWLFFAAALPPDVYAPVPPDAPVCNQPPPDVLPAPSDRQTWAGIDVIAIRATNDWEGFDPPLEPMRKVLGYTRYSGFRVLSSTHRNLHVGEALTAEAAGLDLQIELTGTDRKRALLHAILRRGHVKVVDTSVGVQWNRSFMLAGPKLGDDVLVAAITVR